MSIPLLGAHSKFEFHGTGFLDIFYNESALIIDTELEPDSPFFRLHTNEANIDRTLTKCHILACNSRFIYEYNFSHRHNSTHPTIHEREREFFIKKDELMSIFLYGKRTGINGQYETYQGYEGREDCHKSGSIYSVPFT